MANRVLHVLSQRPGRTGSGVTLDSLVRCAARAGWDQHVVVGTSPDDPHPPVGGLPPDRIHPLVFGTGSLDFALPGMSDVMPYASTPFSSLTGNQLHAYRSAWRRHVAEAIATAQPDVIHSHHVWILGAILKDIAPDIPIVTRCHATGLRQMALCPHLADEVRSGCARNERFVVLHRGHADALVEGLGIPGDRIRIVGGGFRRDFFHDDGRADSPGPALVYAGKYSHAKGLPWLLDAVEGLVPKFPGLVLHVAGSGAGTEAESLRQRMAGMAPTVVMHGQLSQAELAELLRRSAVFVLPSFYEGLPLVLIEAAACGCRLVCTRLPGVVDQWAPHVGEVLEMVPLPRLTGVDVPLPEDLPAFVNRLVEAVEAALGKPRIDDPFRLVAPFTWESVFGRVEAVWREVTG